VEVKSVLATHEVHKAQALTYMKFTNCPAGLVINFNVPRLMDGVNRLVLEDRLGDRADSGI
jgi:GxxExxY protein